MIIVTGGAGFIGSALVWRLNQAGVRDVLIVDRLASDESKDAKRRNIEPLSFANYMDADEFLAAVTAGRFDRGVRAILHLGAISSTTETDADLLRRNNTDYTRVLAEFAIHSGVRFIYASSAATYGDGSNAYADDIESLQQLRPLNLYGESKHRFDLWAKSRGILDRIVGLKYFNVFGPNEYHKGDMKSVVVKAYDQIRRTGTVRLFKSCNPLYADGEQVRDFLYVKDAVDMTLFFLDRPKVNGIFNIGSGLTHTWKQLVTPVFHALNVPVAFDFIDMPAEIRDKYQYHTLADMRRLRAAGYDAPVTPLNRAVSEYVRDFLIPDRVLT